MHSGPTQTASYTALPLHQRDFNRRPNDQSTPVYGLSSRQTIGLPPPIEPRTSHPLQSVFPDHPQPPPRRDTYAAPSAPHHQERRPHGQSLPRLQDILTSAASPAPATPAHAPFSASWSAPGPPPANDVCHPRPAIHPPLVYPHHLPPAYLPGPGQLPIVETSSIPRDVMHPGQHSPRSAIDAVVDHRELRQAPNGPYHSPVSIDDGTFRNPSLAYDQHPNGQYGPPDADFQRKYQGTREVPGEGWFHVYEGGFRIPTHVDGEQVNPAWGLTKANKPRKRLAMACLDCREKKIKCEPGGSSCLQCEKAKRPCRKAPAHSESTAWPSGGTPPARRDSSDPTYSSARSADADAAQKRRTRDEHSPSRIPAKKHRSASPGTVPFDPSTVPRPSFEQAYPIATSAAPQSITGHPGSEEDPYAANPDMVIYLINIYFSCVNNMIYDIFPQKHFMHWLKSCPHKWQHERIVLHAMLAVGSIFVGEQYNDGLEKYGRQCADYATNAINSTIGRPNTLILQARLILSVWYASKGDQAMALDYFKLAAGAAALLEYNTEQGCMDVTNRADTMRNEYDFSLAQLAENRRRTMWSLLLMDRYSLSSTCVIDTKNLFLRLPCIDEHYETGRASDASLFNDALTKLPDSPFRPNNPITTNGWLLLVAAMCGDVVNFIYRAPHTPARSYEDAYKHFHSGASNSLENWLSRLPEYLTFNQANLERSVNCGYDGAFFSMHMLYHYSVIKLNRFFRHELIPDQVARNIVAVYSHAQELVKMAVTVHDAKANMADPHRQPPIHKFTVPFAGRALLSANDIVGGGGLENNMRSSIDLLDSSRQCIRELTPYWASAREECSACDKRFYQIQNLIKKPSTAHSGCWLGREWGIADPLDNQFAPADDCIYGVEGRVYYLALKGAGYAVTSTPALNKNGTSAA